MQQKHARKDRPRPADKRKIKNKSFRKTIRQLFCKPDTLQPVFGFFARTDGNSYYYLMYGGKYAIQIELLIITFFASSPPAFSKLFHLFAPYRMIFFYPSKTSFSAKTEAHNIYTRKQSFYTALSARDFSRYRAFSIINMVFCLFILFFFICLKRGNFQRGLCFLTCGVGKIALICDLERDI